ncbi:beta-1,6-N-acetylglucosaminyltransferase [Hymenobacter artigasi]|uniref:Peptide O-xylosyltransferase n=1 Tax=Hymenobacter artigasi TaxID=2719616 RepID=A0ABX1HK81_9BACT|nr:beta-1,6-N-acetylglucosaminyltransferase [Hymenobacter artigasi]NKI89361.1 hypothetical protein [Hymenobacter artigasi]
MRIAHLILTHQGPAQLARLLAALTHPNADCYVHVDKKADLAPFAFLQNQPGVFFTRTRLDVQWGGYSLTNVVLAGSLEILAHPARYDFINVLSGQDYPLKSAEQIHRFFQQQAGQSFIECEPLGSAWWQANARRVERYHLTEFPFAGSHAVQKVLNALLPKRRFPLPYVLHGGNMGGWYTLSRAAATYLLAFLDRQPRLRRFARLTWGSDEFLIHTILYNSPLRPTIVNDNMRYIDWAGGGPSPRTLTRADLPALLASPKLWARKFALASDPAVLDALDAAHRTSAALWPMGPGLAA